jgi:hypothetical protein
LLAPSGLTPSSGTITNDTTPTLSWTAPSANGCREVSGYNYEICEDANCSYVVDSGSSDDTIWTTQEL